jgi:hypothetical protein
MTVPGARPRRGRIALTVLAIIGGLLLVPIAARAAIPADEPAPAWVAPYVDEARASLVSNDDAILADYRFIGTRCAGDSVAILFERRPFPFLASSGAYAMSGDWPPSDPPAFGGGLDVQDFDQSLPDDWVPGQTWHACEPR